MSEANQYRLKGLSQLDVRQIRVLHPEEAFRVEAPEPTEGRHNELATLAVVGGLALLGQAAAYFFGKSSREEVLLTVEEIHPDGSVRTVCLKLHRSSTEPIENQIVEALKGVN